MAFDINEDHQDEEFDEYEDVKQPTTRPKFYRRRKFWFFCIPQAIITLIIAVVLALYVIMPKIAQGLMNKATINFSQIDITNPTATSINIIMVGEMDHTGPFHADISFPGIVTVSWNDRILGTTVIPGTSTASGGHGALNLQSSFQITNASAFTEFSSYILNAETFVWHLEGKLNVKALSHTVKNLNLNKDITVSAFHGLTGIKIEKFSLPGDDPAGKGILVDIDTSVTNPSAIQIYMGSLTLAISYKNTLMGYVTSSNLTMVRGAQTLSMQGYLIPQTTPEGPATTSEMMSHYIGNLVTDTIATGYEVKPDGVNSVEWLSSAVKQLNLTVPLQSPTPLQLIKALNLGALGLVFTPPTAYEPTTTSTGVIANYSLPDGFGFNISFTQVANSFTITRGGVAVANLNSTYSPSSSNMAAGTLTFNLLQTPLIVPDASHVAFQEFNRDLTVGADLPFNVVGEASVYANTSIGTVNLVNIPFNASTALSGLQSLANPAPAISSLQVVSGTATELTMAISVVIVNPSSISLNSGDVTLNLIYSGTTLGTVTMPNLNLVPGANIIAATSSINPAATPEGMELLTLYTSGAGASVSISGTPTSTTVDSLTLAFGALNIGTQMPGLQSKLLGGASLVVLDTTLVDGMAQTVVTVNNPFVPAMTILSIDSKITYNGVALGTVVSTFPTPQVIPGTGSGSITASLAMNTNPQDLVTLIRAQAIKNGLSTAAFDGLLALQAGGTPSPDLFIGFNVADFVTKAMTGLNVDITMTTTVKLGDYQVTMPYTQTGVPTGTDQTILKLIPIVGTPIAQILVNGSALAFDAITINNPSETSFTTNIVGAITKTGPLDAQIAFPNPVTVSFNGKALGSMQMPTVNAVANKGASLNLATVPFTISDSAAFGDFTSFALNNAKFDWTISTTGIVVNAMGVSLPGVSMTKTVTLDGFSKLPDLTLLSYIINSIDNEGLHMVISAELANPSAIGMTIPISEFNTQFNGVVLGPAFAYNLALVPHSNSSFALNATISADGTDKKPYLESIFHNALTGVATPLKAKGIAAPGVSWLNTAVQSLLLNTALPPLQDPPIAAVTINSMEMDFACATCVWAPTAISSITADTKLPFAMDVPIAQLAQNVQILDDKSQVVGTLNTPYADATIAGSKVSTNTPPAPLTVADGSHDIYTAFVGALNLAPTYQLGLRGTADSILDLGALGKVEVKGIPLDVKTSIAGLQGLQTIDFLSVVQFYPNYLAQFTFVTTVVNIHNPSQLTLNIGDLGMAAGYKGYDDADRIGYTEIFNLRLVPGDNIVPSLLGQGYTAPNAGPFGNDLPLLSPTMTLWANLTATSNPALNAGLSTLRTSVVLPQNLVVPSPPPAAYGPDWTIKILPTTVDDGIIEMSITVNNPFLYEFTVSGDSTSDENDYAFNPSYLTVNNKAGTPFTPFTFTNDFKYTVKAGGSLSLTFKMQLHHFGDQSTTTKFIDEFVIDAAAGPIPTLGVFFAPVITLTGYPITVFPDFSSGIFYPSTYVTLHTGPDFPMIKDWFYKGYNVTAAPVPAPSAVSTPSPLPLPPSTLAPSVTPNPPIFITPTPSPPPVTAPSPVASTSVAPAV
ncbi:hypothetical protein EC957_011814 [Mortierella hygrophila]|uniref:Uncharacterized protein n=1 Tax=Mortierella hygrophila TaxID=979708 RepID=A0A9P6F790_9FUNG|nr:hypothetical protein EC957_011814 [Mortierella hygrophila]